MDRHERDRLRRLALEAAHDYCDCDCPASRRASELASYVPDLLDEIERLDRPAGRPEPEAVSYLRGEADALRGYPPSDAGYSYVRGYADGTRRRPVTTCVGCGVQVGDVHASAHCPRSRRGMRPDAVSLDEDRVEMEDCR